MTQDPADHALARRTVLKGAGLGLSAGLMAGVAPTAQAASPIEAAADTPVWSAEYWAHKGDVKLSLWRKRVGAPETGRAAAAGAVPGARLVELLAHILRPHSSRQGRIFVHERHGALRLRRLDHGPRRLRLFRQFRQQFRHRQRRRGPQGRDPGRGEGDRTAQDAFLRHLVGRDSRRRLRAGRARAGRPAGAGRLHLQGHRFAEMDRRREHGSTSCAPAIAASAMPP